MSNWMTPADDICFTLMALKVNWFICLGHEKWHGGDDGETAISTQELKENSKIFVSQKHVTNTDISKLQETAWCWLIPVKDGKQ